MKQACKIGFTLEGTTLDTVDGGVMRTLRPRICWILVVTGWLVATPAGARETARVVYVGAEPGPDAEAAVASLLSLVSPSVDVDGEPVHLDAVLGEPGAIGVEAALCSGDPVDATVYGATLVDLYNATFALEDTASLVARIEASQACLTDVVSPQYLARAAFLEGVVAFSDAGCEAATPAFSKVFALHYDSEWDDEHPPDAHDCFVNARDAAGRSERAGLTMLVPDGVEVWLDGALTDPDGIQAIPGRHLVQTQTGNGPLTGISFELTPGSTALVVAPGALDPDAGEGFVARMTHVLDALGDGGFDLVVSLEAHPTAWRWADGTLQVVELRIAREDPRIRQTRAAGAVLLGAGAATAIAGAVLCTTGWTDAQALLGDMQSEGDGIDPGLYDLYIDDYDAARQTNNAGWVVLAAGGAAALASIPIFVHAHQLEASGSPSVSLVPSPDGLSFGISGQF